MEKKNLPERLIPIPRRFWAALAVMLAIVMSVMDGTMINVALPTLAAAFGTTPSETIWVVNAYQLVITMSLLSFASIGDLYGYRKVFMAGISVFVAASVACACASSLRMLVGSRVIQGIGAAGIMSVNTALLRQIYPPEFLGRGLSLNAMLVAVSAAAGPSLAGGLLSIAPWSWLFLINVPFGILTWWIGYRLLPKNHSHKSDHHFDKAGAIANALVFGLLIYSLEGFAHDENRTLILTQLAIVSVVGFFFIRRELKLKFPLLPVDLLKIPIFALSIGSSVSSFTAQMLATVSLPFFMQNIWGYSAAEVGMLFTPWPLATILTAPVAGRLLERIHPGLLGMTGMLIYALGACLLYFLPEQPDRPDIAWRMAVCGIGFGLFQTPNNYTIVSSAPRHRSGAASGMQSMARLLGQTLGTTLVALLFKLFVDETGSRASLLLAIACALLAAIISGTRIIQPIPGRKNQPDTTL